MREQENHPTWGKTVKYLLRQGGAKSTVSGSDKGDHPPITPMKAAPRDEFNKGNDWRLYDYITRHFIASLMDDVQYEEHTYMFDIGGEEFVFTCHVVQERGFLYAMPWKAKDLKLAEVDWQMPNLSPREKVDVQEVWVDQDTTRPPDYLKESELVSLMDKHGIGTDASIPQHMQNIVDRHYCMICGPAGEDGEKGIVISKGGKKGGKAKGKGKGKDGKGGGGRPPTRHMVPTYLGLSFLAAFEALDSELCEPAIRSYMEKQCAQIADGILERSEVTSQNLDLFHKKFLKFREGAPSLDRFFARKDTSHSVGDDSGWRKGRWKGNEGDGGARKGGGRGFEGKGGGPAGGVKRRHGDEPGAAKGRGKAKWRR